MTKMSQADEHVFPGERSGKMQPKQTAQRAVVQTPIANRTCPQRKQSKICVKMLTRLMKSLMTVTTMMIQQQYQQQQRVAAAAPLIGSAAPTVCCDHPLASSVPVPIATPHIAAREHAMRTNDEVDRASEAPRQTTAVRTCANDRAAATTRQRQRPQATQMMVGDLNATKNTPKKQCPRDW